VEKIGAVPRRVGDVTNLTYVINVRIVTALTGDSTR